MSTAPVTLLFTDLVNSTELLERAGDEHTQRILRTHHLALQQAVAIHGGSEVKWLGDGLMSVFASPADAVRCAVAMQQAARRRVGGGAAGDPGGVERRRVAARGGRLLRHPGGGRAAALR